MARLDVVQWGADRLRVAAWRGDERVAVLTPSPGQPAHPEAVAHAASVLGARGVGTVLTAALPPAEQRPFLEHGFVVRERLHLLRHALDGLDDLASHPAAALRVRRGWRRDYPTILALDALAFSPFWRFDRHALADARSATPSSQFRVVDLDRAAGYAVTGRAGEVCYLQRLAVHPDQQRRGVGTALVLDALRWAAGHRSRAVLVNTQEGNAEALHLYERLGFRREHEGLAVLERPIDGRAS